ncbi:phosphatidylglycerophosphatase and protein-tyrosine phosphatase 1 [Hydra vulgaris]|uniref:Phosphatidylglycerophosphatase and protein-tyrosine phosphatase 1 n=1 Tax=Hydra vulgaris TaxID=6087 RepID=T2M8M8_HYDVU|nr:phosphatidylglycerophosphatase and protein-tyrosine phosphatase 1 [Hydra vulgaris]
MVFKFHLPLWSQAIIARLAFYPTLVYGCLRTSPNRRWYDRIDNKVILGALPFYKTAKALVSIENISAVITLNEPYELRYFCPKKTEWNLLGVQQLHIPTVEYSDAPSISKIESALDFINKSSSSVYVHCKAGRSRSATVVVCYLIKQYKMSSDDAIQFVREKRPHIAFSETHYQRILEFSSIVS